jgi:signal transduction histidine kinase
MSAILIELGKLESARAGAQIDRSGLASVRRLAEENVAKVRNMALLLRPAMLDELGLVPALRWHARGCAPHRSQGEDDCGRTRRRLAGFLSDLRLSGGSRGAQQLRQTRTGQRVRVVIHRDGEGCPYVQDNGWVPPAHNKGLGLLGMMERVNGLGGQFHINRNPGKARFFPRISSLKTPL